MGISRFNTVLAGLAMVGAAAAAHAQTLAPTGSSFGSLPGATFGGSGIPNNAVETTINGTVTLGLSATQRYSSPPLTNNNAGTFSATPGISTGAPTNAGFADWNFDWYVNGASTSDVFEVLVNTTPGGPLFPWAIFSGNNQNSSNLGFAPSFLGFNPDTPGTYTIKLAQIADPEAGTIVGNPVVINVDVGATTTPEPSSLAFLGTGFVGLAGFVKRRARAS